MNFIKTINVRICGRIYESVDEQTMGNGERGGLSGGTELSCGHRASVCIFEGVQC